MGRRWNGWGGSGYAGAGGGGGMGIDALPFDSPIAIVPNDTLHVLWWAPADITITGIRLFYQTAPVSAAGTYLFAATGAGNNLLNAATFNLETLVAATLTTMVLTGTAADLNLAADDAVDLSFTSNNADLTATGGYVQILYVGR